MNIELVTKERVGYLHLTSLIIRRSVPVRSSTTLIQLSELWSHRKHGDRWQSVLLICGNSKANYMKITLTTFYHVIRSSTNVRHLLWNYSRHWQFVKIYDAIETHYKDSSFLLIWQKTLTSFSFVSHYLFIIISPQYFSRVNRFCFYFILMDCFASLLRRYQFLYFYFFFFNNVFLHRKLYFLNILPVSTVFCWTLEIFPLCSIYCVFHSIGT